MFSFTFTRPRFRFHSRSRNTSACAGEPRATWPSERSAAVIMHLAYVNAPVVGVCIPYGNLCDRPIPSHTLANAFSLALSLPSRISLPLSIFQSAPSKNNLGMPLTNSESIFLRREFPGVVSHGSRNLSHNFYIEHKNSWAFGLEGHEWIKILCVSSRVHNLILTKIRFEARGEM